MRKSIVLFLFLQLITSYSYAQSGWVLQNTSHLGNIGYLEEIAFPSRDTGYICSQSGAILKTTNTGFNWVVVGVFNNTFLTDIYFINNQTGFVAGSRKLLKTTNGGDSWDSLNTNGMMSQFCCSDVLFFNSSTGFAAAQSIYKTTNNGQNWNEVLHYYSNFGKADDIQFINSQTGFCYMWYYIPMGSNYTWVFKTTNAGLNWTDISTLVYNGHFDGFQMIDENLGFATGNTGQITFKTTNGGVNWTNSIVKAASVIYFLNANTGYFTGYKTTNSGINWWIQNVDIQDRARIKDIVFIDANTGFMVGGINGVIFKTTDAGGGLIPLSVVNITKVIPNKYFLHQNYPNPFNPQTKIKFAVPSNVKGQASNVKLIIYDLLGREVTTLVNEELKPGTYEADWDGSNFSSGVYFYKIFSSEFTETRKMVLMK